MTALVLALLMTASPVPVVDAPPGGPDLPAASGRSAETLLVLDFEVDDQGVNARDDAEIAALAGEATRLFREEVERGGRFELVREESDGGTSADPATRASECRTGACLREAARRAGATHVVRGRYVKVSNLIRYLAVEMVDVSEGGVVRRASAELKGQRDAILRRAVAILHERLEGASGREAGGIPSDGDGR